jgi:hypothetical protein
MRYSWTCSCCGKQFDTLPLDWAFDAPAYWRSIPESERPTRGTLSSDFCTADEHFFIRGCLEIPLVGTAEKLVWGAWVSQSAASFRRAMELFDREPDATEKPRFGWLNNEIHVYRPSTLGLKANVHFRPKPLRPLIELQPSDHPLAAEQRSGATLQRVQEIITAIMPRH